MAWTEEQKLAKKEQMKAYHAKKKAAKEAQKAVEAVGVKEVYGIPVIVGNLVEPEGVTAPTPESVAQDWAAELNPPKTEAQPLQVVKKVLPETFKDMPSHLVEKYRNFNQ